MVGTRRNKHANKVKRPSREKGLLLGVEQHRTRHRKKCIPHSFELMLENIAFVFNTRGKNHNYLIINIVSGGGGMEQLALQVSPAWQTREESTKMNEKKEKEERTLFTASNVSKISTS